MRAAISIVCALLFCASSAIAQDPTGGGGENPEPCSPQSPMYTDCQQGSNGGCGACWATYCAVYDANYGIACDAYCTDPTAPCSPDRTTITSGPSACTVNLQRCPPSSPYLCTFTQTETDNCTGQLCSQTLGSQFCSPNTGLLKDKPYVLTGSPGVCGTGRLRARLDRFGPSVEPPRPSPIPAGLLLKARYEVMKRSWHPGDKCRRRSKI